MNDRAIRIMPEIKHKGDKNPNIFEAFTLTKYNRINPNINKVSPAPKRIAERFFMFFDILSLPFSLFLFRFHRSLTQWLCQFGTI